ncbi:hypothetical protein GCM10010276_86440 [Streptomyces longisporus]|uniref:Uncharacterized protein n=1 Tax=Streptomyces longisporus TaxID=1948 RepID=A0ABN3NI73_STRLO
MCTKSSYRIPNAYTDTGEAEHPPQAEPSAAKAAARTECASGADACDGIAYPLPRLPALASRRESASAG